MFLKTKTEKERRDDETKQRIITSAIFFERSQIRKHTAKGKNNRNKTSNFCKNITTTNPQKRKLTLFFIKKIEKERENGTIFLSTNNKSTQKRRINYHIFFWRVKKRNNNETRKDIKRIN